MPDIINTIIALFLTALFFVVLALAISQPIISIWAAVTGRGRFLAYFVGVFLAGVVLLPVLHTVVVDSHSWIGIPRRTRDHDLFVLDDYCTYFPCFVRAILLARRTDREEKKEIVTLTSRPHAPSPYTAAPAATPTTARAR